jgi:hypothetical protein
MLLFQAVGKFHLLPTSRGGGGGTAEANARLSSFCSYNKEPDSFLGKGSTVALEATDHFFEGRGSFL